MGAGAGHRRVRGPRAGALDLRPAHEPHRHHGHRPDLRPPARRTRSFSFAFLSISIWHYTKSQHTSNIIQWLSYLSLLISLPKCDVDPTHSRVARGELIVQCGDRTLDKGPGTVFCDYLSYIFMFLSVATSNMVATSLAKKDEDLAQHQVSMLLFIALTCGIGMFLFTKVFGTQALTAFAGSGNYEIISSANTYAQIRGFAWPAVLVGLVAQSASLGMKDSWGPLKALAAATAVNGVGDILLCSVCGFGIAGAAWATMVSQVVAAFMMMRNLNNKGFRAFSFTIPSARELLQIFEIAAPVFVTMTSKVAFYALLTYSATSMGAVTLAAHQVMINILCMCTVWGEPLSQTAQSFMPELIYGANRNLNKARMLLKSLMIIGGITGAVLGAVGTLVPWLFPSLFTNDRMVVQQMHKVLAPYFSVLLVTPSVHSLEGTLLAGRDLRYLSQSMGVCFCIGTLLLMVLRNKFGSLPGCWWILVLFQWSRFASGLQRLISPMGMLYNENFNQVAYIKTKAT